FADPQHATPNEVITALNARLTHATATVLPNNTIALDSLTDGPDARLEIDVKRSNHISALGLPGGVLATGSWDDTISWQAPQDVASAAPGRHADLFALQMAAGVIWLFWS